ncbi:MULTISPECIES: hypothetical protein [Luteimonas]|uniref:hypothetical protein n=1 Tax=Luteimonas TaxID=83614 RepID=UPI00130450DF|nr:MULTISPECIES: hypothetical protein [Luteimonas]
MIVSTTEPFWQARVEGDVILLTGVDAPARRLPGASDAMTSDGRRIAARDAAGEVVVIVRKMRCEDAMSGAEFPMTGLLTIDGVGPIHGCARPASMPPPMPPEGDAASDTAAIPARWQGRWGADVAACADPDVSIEGLTVAADALRFHESIAVPTAVEPVGDDAIRVTSDDAGEGEQWTATRTLRLEDGDETLVVAGADGASMRRVRCEE